MIKKLLVIIPDRLSVLIQKGEVVPRYYNPGNLFDEVHIMMTNDDMPDPKLVQPMVGDAKLVLHNFSPPEHFFRNTLGWQPFLMKGWLESALKKLQDINPSIIRCYGMHLNLIVASYYKKKCNVPLLVSLHTHPYLDAHRENRSFKEKIIHWCELKIAKNLHYADLVMPVYKGIINFLDSLNIDKYEVLYNTIGISEKKHIKKDWDCQDSFKLVCVGQQIPNKNPENLIKAVARLDNVSLDIIGQGVLHRSLKELVVQLVAEDKIHFIESIPHLDLCEKLKTYDCFAASIDCIGLSKTIIESFLVGLPVLININSHMQVPELDDSMCKRVPDTVEGYISGIKDMMRNKDLRKSYSQKSSQIAWQQWDPRVTEQHHKSTYQIFLSS